MCINIDIYIYVYMYLMYIICIIYVYIYIRLVCFSEKYLCACVALLPSNVQCLQLARQAWLGLGQTLLVAPQICTKKSQVKEMNVSVHKIEAFRSCSRFHTLCISSLLVFYISWYLLISLVAMFGTCCTVFLWCQWYLSMTSNPIKSI